MPVIGEIRAFASNRVPSGWAECNGDLVGVGGQYAGLFRVVKNIYGGDGVTQFGLPDMRGRTLMGAGEGFGQSPRHVGEKPGSEKVTLLPDQMPAHRHFARGRLGEIASQRKTPQAGDYISRLVATPQGPIASAYDTPFILPGTRRTMHASMVGQTGSGQAHENRQPYLPLLFCIALEGTLP
ncbi:tail fiber protein [Sphingomonas sp. AOB5]|uniref:phage tail protein n=1 Tax=Sphingomonas sp. AOB5 TaxID=3034017 RepID=UPI0023F9A2C3|nr:tail fiber protein [Sphingomonas sp. AOB5]MDF7774900.1 tail fiber protein [Sphingomonas sp. AOB5]